MKEQQSASSKALAKCQAAFIFRLNYLVLKVDVEGRTCEMIVHRK